MQASCSAENSEFGSLQLSDVYLTAMFRHNALVIITACFITAGKNRPLDEEEVQFVDALEAASREREQQQHKQELDALEAFQLVNYLTNSSGVSGPASHSQGHVISFPPESFITVYLQTGCCTRAQIC